MRDCTKVVLIGAGSAVFTQGLVADFIMARDLWPLHISLVDINPTTLDAISKVVRSMVDRKQADITVSASVNRREVLPGANVVVTTVAVGGRRGWEQDVFIPRKYGIFQPVGDTTMPGGISRALRMIPAMLDIARDVADLAPDAYFFNYSNPMTPICTAIRKAVGFPVVGLCHGVIHVEHYLAQFIGKDPAEVRSLGIGLNHLTFLYDLRVNGEDAWPIVNQVLDEQKSRYPETYHSETFAEMGSHAETLLYCDEPFSWQVYERFGAFPAVLDRHVVEFFPERFATGAYYGKTLGVDAYSFEQVVGFGDRDYERMLALAEDKCTMDERLFERSSGEHEQLIDILRSLFRDERRTFSVNLPNEGAVPNLPSHAVLELPAVATGRGFNPLFEQNFPDTLASIIRKRLTVIDMTVEAALTGEKEVFVEALLADGSVRGEDIAESLATELLEAHRDTLPQFFGQSTTR